MKIRTKITAGARFVAAFLVVASSLVSAYIALHPIQASAAPAPSGAIVAPTQRTQGPPTDNSAYKCKATISGPSTDHTVPVDSELADPDGLRSDAASTMDAARSGKGMLVVTFSGVNNNSTNNSLCSNAMKLYRSASSANATTFYGYWNKGHLPQDPNGNYVLVTATVNPSSKDVTFTLSSQFTPSGSFDLALADPNSLLSSKTYFPGGGGGGSTSSGGNCFEHASTSDQLKKCINAASPADFTNAGEITYAGDTYTATGWGNVSNKIVYRLSKGSDSSRTSGGISQIVMDTTQKNLDINMDNKGELSQIQSIADALRNAVGASSTVTLELDNVDIGGDQVKANITALPAGMATFATYYAQDDAVTLVFPTAGTNEQPYFGTYTRVKGSNKFSLAGSNWGGKCSNLATFAFDSDPKNASGTTYQGSSPSTNTLTTADWQLNANDGPCTVGHVPVKVALNTKDSAPDTNASTTTTAGTPTINCSVSLFNPLSWFLCPLASALEVVVTSLDNEINNFLDLPAGKGSYGSSCNNWSDHWCNYYQSWTVIRNISLGLIAVFALIAVVSQAFGFEIFDAYTIRKVLPRLLIVAIGITLSWPLMMFFINLTNDLGFGVRQLIYAPFSGLKDELGGGAQFIGAFFGVGSAILLLGFAGLLSFVATGALAAAVAFLVLILRQMVIAMLVIFAPVAIACYVLPGTQKVWKLWWDSFSRGLLMFPIIAAFIAIGRVFAAVNSHGTGSINQIIAFVAYFAPYFMIPFTFRLAGGAIATIGGIANNTSRGAFDRLKKFRTSQVDKNIQGMATGNRFQGDSKAAKAFNDFTRNAALIPHAGFNPAKMGQRMQAAGSRHTYDEAVEAMEKNSAVNAVIGNDDYLQAALKHPGDERGMKSYLQNKGYSEQAADQGVAAIRAARRSVSNEVFDVAAAMALPGTGTAYKPVYDDQGNLIGGGAGEMHHDINEVAGDDRVLANRMLVKARSNAAGARRFDLAGGGFGSQSQVLENQYNGSMKAEDATRRIIRESLEGQGGNYIAGTKKAGVIAFSHESVNVLNEKLGALQQAAAKANSTGDAADMTAANAAAESFQREIAKVAGRYDGMAQTSPENAEEMSKILMNAKIGTQSVRQLIDNNRGNADFQSMRREYERSTTAAAVNLQNQQAGAPTPPTPFGPNPGAGPLGPVGTP